MNTQLLVRNTYFNLVAVDIMKENLRAIDVMGSSQMEVLSQWS